jgi:hypothetical protein
VVVLTGLIASAFLALVAYLDHSQPNLAVFGGLSLVFLIAWLRIRTLARR